MIGNRRRIELVDTREDARRMRQTFMDREPESEARQPFTWPPELQEVGRCLSLMYRSDKWTKRWEDYKHVAEFPQEFLCERSFLETWDGKILPVHGPLVEMPDVMPRHFAFLSDLIGVQVHLYGANDKLAKEDAARIEIRVPRARLGGARLPDTGMPFLFVYTTQGVHAIVTGPELDVEKDGIVG